MEPAWKTGSWLDGYTNIDTYTQFLSKQFSCVKMSAV